MYALFSIDGMPGNDGRSPAQEITTASTSTAKYSGS